MKKRLIFTLFLMAFSIGFSIAPANRSNDNETIVVKDERIPLRQYAMQDVKKANDSSAPEVANIETTNVDYDLRYIFGGAENYRKFNISTLIPTKDDSKDTSYKFICAKPVGENLYLYVYHENNDNDEISSARFTISTSTNFVEETAEFIEEFETKTARFINSYGYKKRFMKFVVDKAFKLDEDVRVYIKDFSIVYEKENGRSYSTESLIAEDEMSFKPNGNTDFVAEYWQNEYVRVTGAEVGLLLTKDNRHGGFDRVYSAYNEDFYYFFNTDHKIDELIAVDYDYQLFTYDAEMKWNSGEADMIGDSKGSCYSGLYNNGKGEIGNGAHQNLPKSIEMVTDEWKFNNHLEKTSYTVEVSRPNFWWSNKKVKYSMSTIIDCKNLDELDDLENADSLVEFVEDIQNERKKASKPEYEWAFRVANERREVIEGYSTGWLSWEKKHYSISRCHEVKQTMITYLKFRTDGVEFEFNVLDIPRDTTSVHLANVPYDTLMDEIWDNVVSGVDWFKTCYTKVLDNIVPITIAVVSVVLFVMAYPFLKSTAKVVKASTESKVRKKSKKGGSDN